jgi:hypothetical protein
MNAARMCENAAEGRSEIEPMSEVYPGEGRAAQQRASRQQCAGAVLMIRPASFDYNPETAATNPMQQRAVGGSTDAGLEARNEFDRFVQALSSEGISVCVAADTPQPPKPDAVFPNNWVSFHEDGTVVLYPMHAPNRQRERRQEVIDTVVSKLGFKVTRVVDLSDYENEGMALEGTGSLVLDHVERVAYASLSPRTHPVVVEEWCRELAYEPVMFESADRHGVPPYHTNVLMSIGERAVVVGSAAIAERDRVRVLDRLRAGGRDVIEIGHDEIEHFAANMLEVASWDEALGDCRVLVMSAAARQALSPQTYERLSGCTDAVLAVPVPTIERLGGGSVRCMLAEVFLPT